MNSQITELPVEIVMIEDDEGHARLIEKNIRRAGVNNQIKPFTERHRRGRITCSARTARRRRTRAGRCWSCSTSTCRT